MIRLLGSTRIPFMRYRKIFYALSAGLVLATLAWLALNGGPRYSIDFSGGTLLQVRTATHVPIDRARTAVTAAGFGEAEIQAFGDGHEFLVRLPEQGARSAFPPIREALEAAAPGAAPELRREESVGAKVGGELRGKALMAILVSLGGILLYVTVRYEAAFAIGGVLALLHDVVAALGLLMFLGREVSLPVVAALLTIAGFSINDTMVVFDRIREHLRKNRSLDRAAIIDIAVNETLSRTIITALTVFLVVASLYVFGGSVLNDFALCLGAGILFGTYSSVYVATGMALDLSEWRERRRAARRLAPAASAAPEA